MEHCFDIRGVIIQKSGQVVRRHNACNFPLRDILPFVIGAEYVTHRDFWSSSRFELFN